MRQRCYEYHGKVIFVHKIATMRYGTFWLSSEGEFVRFLPAMLPARRTLKTAQEELDVFALVRHLKDADLSAATGEARKDKTT